jgi:hypothetical protein
MPTTTALATTQPTEPPAEETVTSQTSTTLEVVKWMTAAEGATGVALTTTAPIGAKANESKEDSKKPMSAAGVVAIVGCLLLAAGLAVSVLLRPFFGHLAPNTLIDPLLPENRECVPTTLPRIEFKYAAFRSSRN